MKRIAIIDYGLGNLLSIKRAIERFTTNVSIIDDASELFSYDAAILPGVGAFKDGMLGLERRGFIDAIKQYATLEKPLLGICLGMQLLFDSSEEFGFCSGLNLIEGQVSKIPANNVNQTTLRIPHVGWSPVISKANSFFSNVPSNMEYYFCHSYAANPARNNCTIAKYEYGGHMITAAVNSNNIYGFQFHPEKSGNAGLILIEKFLQHTRIL